MKPRLNIRSKRLHHITAPLPNARFQGAHHGGKSPACGELELRLPSICSLAACSQMVTSAFPIPLFGGTFSPAKLIALLFSSRYDDLQIACRPPPALGIAPGQRKERHHVAMGGQLENENYKHWRRRWLRWHSRSLLAGTLVLQRAERDAYLDEMLKTYHAYGDFTENEIAFIFRRVSHGVRRLASHLEASVCARRAQKKIRAQGLRLMTDAAEIFGQGF